MRKIFLNNPYEGIRPDFAGTAFSIGSQLLPLGIDAFSNQGYNYSNPDEFDRNSPVFDTSFYRDNIAEASRVGRAGDGSVLSGVVSGASSAASTGNPFAIAGGALVGGTLGLIKKNKARNREKELRKKAGREYKKYMNDFNDLNRQNALQTAANDRMSAIRNRNLMPNSFTNLY